MSPHNRAAWLMKKQDPVQIVDDAPYNKPEADEIVVQTMAIAFNPADFVVQKLGIIVDVFPAILGCDMAGVVEEVGSGIMEFQVGDRVVGQGQPKAGGINKYATFQQYVVIKMPLVAKIPDSISWTDAAVLPLGMNTASSCLFREDILALDMPPSQGGKGKTLLIWGASGSVGSCGVQLAAAAGYEVFGIASKKNHDFVKSIGASKTFDQNDPDIINHILTALEGKTCVGAFDSISKKETLNSLDEILYTSGARKFISSIMPGSDMVTEKGVAIRTNFGPTHFQTPIGHHIWRVFLEPALNSGAFQCKPTAEVVGHGLEEVQKACDLLAQGVSAKKIVITV